MRGDLQRSFLLVAAAYKLHFFLFLKERAWLNLCCIQCNHEISLQMRNAGWGVSVAALSAQGTRLSTLYSTLSRNKPQHPPAAHAPPWCRPTSAESAASAQRRMWAVLGPCPQQLCCRFFATGARKTPMSSLTFLGNSARPEAEQCTSPPCVLAPRQLLPPSSTQGVLHRAWACGLNTVESPKLPLLWTGVPQLEDSRMPMSGRAHCSQQRSESAQV